MNSFSRFLTSIYFVMLTIHSAVSFADKPSHYTSLLKDMFAKVTIAKNDTQIPFFYSKDFELFSNGKRMNFNEFLTLHQAIYKTPIQYQIRYDENTWVEQGNRVAGRLFITTKKPDEAAHDIEVMLIAEYKEDKLYRLWELTYPDWSNMESFKNIPQITK